MSEDLWYYSRDGEEKMGPTPGEHLRSWLGSGQLPGDTLVWGPGLEDWTPIQEVPALGVGSPPPPGSTAVSRAENTAKNTYLPSSILDSFKQALRKRSLIDWANLKILGAALGAFLVVLKFVILPTTFSRAASVVAERYGVELSVGDWDADISDLSGSAQKVVIEIPGPYAEKEFVNAEEIEIDVSLLSGLLDDQWIKAIRIQEPKIYVERKQTGHWNWQDIMSRPVNPPSPTVLQASMSGSEPEAAESSFSLPSLSIEGMYLQWVEKLPGGSRGGVIHDLTATLFVDDISALASNLEGLVDPRQQPESTFRLEARTGSGKVSFSGRANFFAWMVSPSNPTVTIWVPMLDGNAYLENIETNALARLIPDAAILPQTGSMTGNIKLRVERQQVECQANLNIQDTTFAANQASPFVADNFSTLQSGLDGINPNGQVLFSCGGHLGKENYRPVQAFQTNVIRKAVSQASPEVRAYAEVAHVRYSQDPIEPGLEGETRRILGQVDPQWLNWVGFAAAVDSRVQGSGIRPRFPRPFRR